LLQISHYLYAFNAIIIIKKILYGKNLLYLSLRNDKYTGLIIYINNKRKINMKTISTLKGMLFSVLVFFALTTGSNAFLNGVYVEVGSSAVGVEAGGSTNDAQGAITTGTVGKTAVTGTYGLGYVLGSGKFSLDAGYMWTPGEAKISQTSTSNNANTVSLEVSDSTEYYLAPTLNITDDAALYLKFGKNDSDLKVVGDVNKINSMTGDTVAIGTVMSWGSNLYIRTEAGKTEYDTLKFTGLGSAGSTSIATTESASATPKVHYGKIAIGYKF
jgi:hypothetical protein